ncbi:MAG: type II secretion system protein [Phycisphaerales bacterium]
MSRREARAGFTLVELLVVIGIIAVLAGLLIVGVGAATRRAQAANTRFLMSSMVQAMAQFKADHGYYPPVLGDPRTLQGGTLGWVTNPTASAGPNAPGALLFPSGQVGWMRDLLLPPAKTANAGVSTGKVAQWSSAEARALQNWHSVTSPAEYLLGWGDRSADGYGICGTLPETPPSNPTAGQREVPRDGIRSPGTDGVWGAALTPRIASEVGSEAGFYTGTTMFANRNVGTFGSRNLAVPSRGRVDTAANDRGNDDATAVLRCRPNLEGKVWGPYLELKDPSSLGGIRGIRSDGTLDVVRATDGDPNFDVYPKCIVDYWGSPIRYYRRGYVNLIPSTMDMAADGTRFDLGDFFALRPVRGDESEFVPASEAARECLDDENPDLPVNSEFGGRDRSSTIRLRSAEIAFLSPGPDRRVDLTRRLGFSGPNRSVDVNEDNMVETGP